MSTDLVVGGRGGRSWIVPFLRQIDTHIHTHSLSRNTRTKDVRALEPALPDALALHHEVTGDLGGDHRVALLSLLFVYRAAFAC